jgi:hypothetical protein
VVEVNGREHVVKVIGGGAELEKKPDGRALLRIRNTAEVDGVRSDYTITYGRYGKVNEAVGCAVAKAGVPGGRMADAERFSALIKALTGEGAEGAPHEERQNNDCVLRTTTSPLLSPPHFKSVMTTTAYER